MAESEKLRSTTILQQALAEAKNPWQKFKAHASYYLDNLLGGSARGYQQQMTYYENLSRKRELTADEQTRYQDLKAMANQSQITDRLQ